jgi:hypothetical protein
MWIVLYVATIATLSAMGTMPGLLPLEMDKESEAEGDVVGD